MTDESEISKAARDAFVHGTGFMRDGKHVPLDNVYMTAKEAAADDLVKRLLIAADRADTVFDPDFASPWREAAACIKALEKKNKLLEQTQASYTLAGLGIDVVAAYNSGLEALKAGCKEERLRAERAEKRIKELEAALRKIEEKYWYPSTAEIARAALGEKKDDASA